MSDDNWPRLTRRRIPRRHDRGGARGVQRRRHGLEPERPHPGRRLATTDTTTAARHRRRRRRRPPPRTTTTDASPAVTSDPFTLGRRVG